MGPCRASAAAHQSDGAAKIEVITFMHEDRSEVRIDGDQVARVSNRDAPSVATPPSGVYDAAGGGGGDQRASLSAEVYARMESKPILFCDGVAAASEWTRDNHRGYRPLERDLTATQPTLRRPSATVCKKGACSHVLCHQHVNETDPMFDLGGRGPKTSLRVFELNLDRHARLKQDGEGHGFGRESACEGVKCLRPEFRDGARPARRLGFRRR